MERVSGYAIDDLVVDLPHGSMPDMLITAAEKLIEACKSFGPNRYVMVSAIGVGRDPSEWPEKMVPYYEAKRDADQELLDAGLDHTIVRPGMLTDDPGTGKVEVDPERFKSGDVPRDDVAVVVAEDFARAGDGLLCDHNDDWWGMKDDGVMTRLVGPRRR